MPQLRSGQCDRKDFLIQPWQFDIKEKYSWFHPRLSSKVDCVRTWSTLHGSPLKTGSEVASLGNLPGSPLPAHPSRAVTALFPNPEDSTRASSTMLQVCVALFYCRTSGWRKDILVIIKRELFEDRMFSLPFCSPLNSISHIEVLQLPSIACSLSSGCSLLGKCPCASNSIYLFEAGL